ncbi:glutathione S-transferase family protein [Streptomyces zaomyceticus]|uniref:glutathione S-transferase family protein n=1 Tax=Streptomyces zaomyceticus TaxID=68286 RepID=UPI0036CCA156
MTGDGSYERDRTYIKTRITADGQDGCPVEPGRYRLIIARACPWANRSAIVRRLMGLEGALSMGIAGPLHDERGWAFHLDPGGRDPVLGIEWLREAFLLRDPGCPSGITVPTIVDIPTGRVVTNDFERITLDLESQWAAHQRDGAPDLCPERWRDEIEDVADKVYRDVNDGVYQCGFAGGQQAYDEAYRRLWERLDWLEERLAGRRHLVGDTITEADVRLFPTLVRFDAVYHGHFTCNRQKLTEIPALWAYARDLFQTPGFGDTIDFAQIKAHYYVVPHDINPTGTIPWGPDTRGWLSPHGREELGGNPFGDGTPPGPPPPSERVPPLGSTTVDV